MSKKQTNKTKYSIKQILTSIICIIVVLAMIIGTFLIYL